MVKLIYQERRVNGVKRIFVYTPEEFKKRKFNNVLRMLSQWGKAAAYAIHR